MAREDCHDTDVDVPILYYGMAGIGHMKLFDPNDEEKNEDEEDGIAELIDLGVF